MVSSQKQCSEQEKQDLSKKCQSAVKKRCSKQQAKNQVAAAVAERTKAAGTARIEKQKRLREDENRKLTEKKEQQEKMHAFRQTFCNETNNLASLRQVDRGDGPKRLVRLDPLVKKSSHHKPIQQLARKASTVRVKEIAALIEGDKSMKASESDVEKVLEQVKRHLGYWKPVKEKSYTPKTKRSNKNAVMSPLDDLKVCSGRMSWCRQTGLETMLHWYFLIFKATYCCLFCITGNHMRKLLSGTGPKKMVSVIEKSNIAPSLLKLFTLLGLIQGYAKSSFIDTAEIN
uniref:Uncharacterized protein n=1 Tax=Ditylenchus dipsaci TaxID=166011 RepID=A0A915CPL1_9BILA